MVCEEGGESKDVTQQTKDGTCVCVCGWVWVWVGGWVGVWVCVCVCVCVVLVYDKRVKNRSRWSRLNDWVRCAALAELDRVLEKCGSDKHHILQMQVWVDELSYVTDMNAVRRAVRGGSNRSNA